MQDEDEFMANLILNMDDDELANFVKCLSEIEEIEVEERNKDYE